MRKLIFLLALALPLGAQTSINVSSTTQQANVFRPGYVVGNVTCYGAKQLLKDLNYCNFGYLNTVEYATSYWASNGGTQSTTNFYSNLFSGGGFPANFWQGGTYNVISGTAGTGQLGTGTVTAQTQNQTAGPNFTLSPALSAPAVGGTNSNADTLLVQCRSYTQCPNIVAPVSSVINVSGTASWSTDVSNLSANQVQSLQVANGTITFTLDQLAPQAQNTVSTASVNAININGSYTETHQDKCAVSGCSVSWTLTRGGTTLASGSDSPSPSAWAKLTNAFTGTENGSQNAQLLLRYVCTGTCLFADMTVIEGSTLAGNTTPFRDDFVLALQKAKVGVIRYMGTFNWGSDVTSMLQPYGAVQATNSGPESVTGFGMPIPYPAVLQLAQFLNASVVLDIGKGNSGADYTILANYLGGTCGTGAGSAIRCAAGITTPWNTTFAGREIDPEEMNEAWNGSVGGQLDAGNGVGYGYWMGPLNTAFKAATGYSSTVNHTIASGWASTGQATGPFGWTQNAMNNAGCTNGTQTACPYYMEFAFYLLGALNSITDPFTDEVAEIVNEDSTTNTTSPQPQNAKVTQTYTASFGVHTMVYESSYGLSSGSATPTQSQMNGIANGVQTGFIMSEHFGLMLRDSLIYGPLDNFAIEDEISFGSINGTVQTAWQDSQYFAAGPGQIGSWTDAYRPKFIFQSVMSQAIGANTNLLSCPQSGTPTFNYAGGQGGQVLANSAVPYVNALCFTDGAGHYTVLVWNNNESASEAITLTGNTPSGAVTETLVGNLNALTDNCANGTIGNNSTPCSFIFPTSTTTSGNSYTVPRATMMALNFSTGGSSPSPPTLTGNVSVTGNVTIQ